MNIKVYINGDIVARGTNMKKILNFVGRKFKEGHTDIIISGGKIGSWR
tara:strand:- start:33 stop:176 length:144 start_codon:yes stop_codon:yes gene_type:complete